jgi:Hsp70 protein
MFNSPGNHGHSLGLSVGATNLAGTSNGQTAVLLPAELTVHGQRLTGFVDRVGDPVPLIARDGSKHRPEELLADALGAIAETVTAGAPVSDVAVTVPAHWRPSVVDTLRRNLRGRLPVVSDATAALTALQANPGLPTHGVIVLCDFGGSGTSITLANAAREFSPFGETVRFPDFSGDHIDQALLTHVVAGLGDASHADPSSTAMVGSLVRLRDECRGAKERLSASTATAVVAGLPGHSADIRVTRTELEDLMHATFAEFLAVLDETLERYGVPTASVSAVATVGGGARIPLITQRLSEHLRAPIVTTPHPQLTAAEGAALIAHRSRVVATATTVTPTAPDAAAATATIAATAPSTALAWSQDDSSEDVLPYSDVTDSRPELNFRHEDWQDEPPPRRSPLVLFGLSAVAAAIATAVFGITLLSDTTTTPVEAATTSSSSTTSPAPAAPATLPATPPPQAPQVTTVTAKPAQRSPAAPQRQRPATQQPPAPPTTTEPPTTDPTPPPPWTPPPWTPPTWTPPWKLPQTPPVDPGTGTGETGTGTGTGGTGTGGTEQATGTGTGGTQTGTGTGTESGGTETGTGTGTEGAETAPAV